MSSTSTDHQTLEEEGNDDNMDEIQVYEEDSRIEMLSDIVQELESSLMLTEGASIPDVEITQQNTSEVQHEQGISSTRKNKTGDDEYCDEAERKEKLRRQKVRRNKASVIFQNRQAYVQRTSSSVDTLHQNEVDTLPQNEVDTLPQNEVNTQQQNEVDTLPQNEIVPPKTKRKKRNNIGFISGIPLLDSKRQCHGRDGHHDHSKRVSERNKKIKHVN